MPPKRKNQAHGLENVTFWEKFLILVVSAIVLLSSEMADILVFNSKSVVENAYMLWAWVSLQAVISFTVCWFADKGGREKIFLWMLIGVAVLGFGLRIFPFTREFAPEGIGVSLYPTPLVMAILLDVFPKIPSLRVIAGVIIFEFLPWAFLSSFKGFDSQKLVLWVVIALTVSFFLGLISLRKFTQLPRNVEVNKRSTVNLDQEERQLLVGLRNYRCKFLKYIAFLFPLLPISFALLSGETGFDIIWYSFSYHPLFQGWLTPITFSTMFGIAFGAIFRRLPHISSLTLIFGGIGGGSGALAFASMFLSDSLSGLTLLATATTLLAFFGGMYLAFAGDAIVSMSGLQHRARGAAIFDIFRSLAPCLASLATSFRPSPVKILITFSGLFVFGTILLIKNNKNR